MTWININACQFRSWIVFVLFILNNWMKWLYLWQWMNMLAQCKMWMLIIYLKSNFIIQEHEKWLNLQLLGGSVVNNYLLTDSSHNILTFSIGPLRVPTGRTMGLGTAFIIGFLYTFIGGSASNLLTPSEDMLFRGYEDHDDDKVMSLWEKRIQYIPEMAFFDYSNITVSFFYHFIVNHWPFLTILSKLMVA